MKKIDWDFELNEVRIRRNERKAARRIDIAWFVASTVLAMLLAMGVAGLAGCADAAETLDPTGVWNTTLTWSSGDCGLTGSQQATTTVVRVGDRYAIDEHGASVTGTVTCDANRCRLLFTETGLSGSGTMTLKVDLVVDDEDTITGAGTATVIDEARTCTHAFLASGRLLR